MDFTLSFQQYFSRFIKEMEHEVQLAMQFNQWCSYFISESVFARYRQACIIRADILMYQQFSYVSVNLNSSNFRDHRSPCCMLMSRQCSSQWCFRFWAVSSFLAVKIREYLMALAINSQQSWKQKRPYLGWCKWNFKWIVESFLTTPDYGINSY